MKNKIVLTLGLLALVFSVSFRPLLASSPALIGANLSGGDFNTAPAALPGVINSDYTYPSGSDVDWAKSQGLELVRLPFRWERVHHNTAGVFDAALYAPDIAAIDAALDRAEARGLRVILDMHNYAECYLGTTPNTKIGTAALPISALENTWQLLADHFKNRTSIWGYDIMNEPVGITTAQWVTYSQAVVNAIRSVDTKTAIILPGAPAFSHTSDWLVIGAPLLAVVDPSNNLIYQGHCYFDNDQSGSWTHGTSVMAELVTSSPPRYPNLAAALNVGVDRVKPFVDWCVANNVRGLVGEYGAPHSSDTANWNIVLDRFFDYVKNHGNGLVSGTQWGGGGWWAPGYVMRMQNRRDNSEPAFTPVVSDYATGPGSNYWFPFTWYDETLTTTADYTFPYAFASTTPAATGTLSLSDTTAPYSGTKSAVLNYTIPSGGFAGAGMHIRGPLTAGAVGGVDISKSLAAGHVLSFYARGTTGAAPTITIGTTSNASGVDSGGDTGTGNWINFTSTAPLTGTWQRYEIPLASFLNAQITGAERIQRLRINGAPANGTAYQVNFDRITIGVASTNTAPTVTVNTLTGGSSFPGGELIPLVATASDADVGDNIDYVEFYANNEKIGIDDTAPYEWSTAFSTAGTYALKTIAVDSHGISGQSTNKTITLTSSLAAPWLTQDVGAVAATGSVTSSSGTFTVKGSGADIQGTADEFRYAYQAASGDCTIIARVATIQNTNAWAKSGVMIRESLAAGAKNAFCAVTPTQGVTFQRRTATSGSTAATTNTGLTAPHWVKLERVGSTFTASRSTDGSTWTTIGSATVTMATDVYIGLAATSHADGTLGTSTLNNVAVTP